MKMMHLFFMMDQISEFFSDSRFRFGTSLDVLADFNPNGSIELYYDNSKSLRQFRALQLQLLVSCMQAYV
jgi:hypothetical protein